METVEAVTPEDLARAARMVLGAGRGLEEGVRLSELRRAFRRRVLEVHPDRAAVLGRPEAELAGEFQALAAAYDLLERYAARRVRLRPAAPPRPRPPATSSDHFASGRLPDRRLRLAEFLYYSGRVSWRSAAEALAWQRRQRPPIGRLAVDWGHLAPEDVAALLAARRRDGRTGELFGEYALRKGLLTQIQLLALLGRQHRMQRPIGGFFVEHGILARRDLEDACRDALRHNALRR